MADEKTISIKELLKDSNNIEEVHASGLNPLVMETPVWEFQDGVVSSKNIDGSSGHWAWNEAYIEANDSMDISLTAHALFLSFNLQGGIDFRQGTETDVYNGDDAYVDFAIKWNQVEDATHVEWKMQYLIIQGDGAIGSSWTDCDVQTEHKYDYTYAGAQSQMTIFNNIPIGGLTPYSTLLVRLWRDGQNANDTYSTIVSCLSFGLIYPRMRIGNSINEI